MKLGDSLGRNRKRRKRKSDAVSDLDATSEDGGVDAPADENDPAEVASESAPDTTTTSTGKSSLGRGLSSWDFRTVLAGLGVVVIGGWFFGYALATQIFFPAPSPQGDLYEVPDLRGLGLASAVERLAGAGLEMGATDSITHPAVAGGLVLGQSPLPGQVSRPDSPVRVTLSIGPQMRSVPDVLRLDEARARVVLETSGFVVNVSTRSTGEPRGQVVAVSPPPDRVVALPAEVTLVVSAGPPVVMMPLVLGLGRMEAERVLDSLGLNVTDVEEVFRFGRDQGIVVEQEPAAESELQRGSGVRLKVGRRGAGREQ